MSWNWLIKVNDTDKDNASVAGRAMRWKEPGPLDDIILPLSLNHPHTLTLLHVTEVNYCFVRVHFEVSVT